MLNQLYYGSGHLYNQSIRGIDGNITEIRHSERDRLHQETTRQQGELLSSFGYDAMGRLTKQYSSDHNKGRIVIERDYHYDVLGQLTHLSGQTQLNAKANNTASNISTANSSFKRNHQYQYDKVGRLTEHKLTDYTQQRGTTERFAFDPASNRVPVSTLSDKANDDIAQEKNSIHKSGRPTKLITADKLITYTYGIHGQVLFKTITPAKDGKPILQSTNAIVSNRKSIQHYYNPNNELVKTITNTEEGFTLTEVTTTYYYDAFGRRIAKASDTKVKTKFINSKHLKTVKNHIQQQKTKQQTTLMLWDGNRQAQEYTDTHVFTTVYEQDSFEPVARLVWLKDGLTIAANDEGWYGNNKPDPPSAIQIYHYHNDQLGTPNELTNQQGEVIWLADYQAWGNTARVVWREEKLEQLQVSADELQPIRFQGQSLDEETGLHYNRFRYFDPDLGMFISRDPIGLMGGFNTFQYAPNPTGWVDPLGLKNYREKFWDRAGNTDRSKYQVHHIFPQDLYKQPKVRKILDCHGMGKDDLSNLIGLPKNSNDNPRKGSSWFGTSQHNSDHKEYSKAVANAIIRIGSKGNCVQQKAKLMLLQKTLRRLLNNGQPIMSRHNSNVVQWTLLLKGF